MLFKWRKVLMGLNIDYIAANPYTKFRLRKGSFHLCLLIFFLWALFLRWLAN